MHYQLKMHKKFILYLILFSIPLLGFSCGREEPSDLGVYKTNDNGDTWEQKVVIDEDNDISEISVNEVAVDTRDNNFILIGTKDFGIYRSTDGGDIWNATALNFGTIESIIINPEDNAIIYAAGSFNTVGKIYKSTDAGNNWEEVFSETNNDTPVNSIDIDWYDPRILYAATSTGAFIKSKDSGRSWVAIKRFEDSVDKVKIDSSDSRILYLYTRDELYKSTDAGKNFINLTRNFKNISYDAFHDLAIHPKFSNIIYISADFGLYVSENAGKSWKEVNLLAKPEGRVISHIALDQINPNILYFGFGSNLYISDDSGINWSVKQFTTSIIGDIDATASEENIIYTGIISSK